MPAFATTFRVSIKPMTQDRYAELLGMYTDETPSVEGYLVTSLADQTIPVGEFWVEKKLFESTYFQTTNLHMPTAIEHLRAGRRVKRAKWTNCYITFSGSTTSSAPDFCSDGFLPESWDMSIEDAEADDWEVVL